MLWCLRLDFKLVYLNLDLVSRTRGFERCHHTFTLLDNISLNEDNAGNEDNIGLNISLNE